MRNPKLAHILVLSRTAKIHDPQLGGKARVGREFTHGGVRILLSRIAIIGSSLTSLRLE